MTEESMELEIIINPKTTDDGQPILQVHLNPCAERFSDIVLA